MPNFAISCFFFLIEGTVVQKKDAHTSSQLSHLASASRNCILKNQLFQKLPQQTCTYIFGQRNFCTVNWNAPHTFETALNIDTDVAYNDDNDSRGRAGQPKPPVVPGQGDSLPYKPGQGYSGPGNGPGATFGFSAYKGK